MKLRTLLGTNENGLTYARWLAAASGPLSHTPLASTTARREAWLAGEDPTDHAAERPPTGGFMRVSLKNG